MQLRFHRRDMLIGGLALGLGGCATAASTDAAAARVQPAPAGRPTLHLANFDLAALGYRADEYFVSGTASSYELTGADAYAVRTLQTAPYVTRIVVVRPIDASRFNRTVLAEWMNVSSGEDFPVAWIMAHREVMRGGYAYVGVSAQTVGIEGMAALPQAAALRRADPARYAQLSHPGDAYAYDMFSQIGRALQAPNASRFFDGVAPAHVIGAGESQSAAYLTTYVNIIDPVARAYDGFLVHSRGGGGASLNPGPGFGGGARSPAAFRPDLRVPTLVFQAETDVFGSYHSVRVPDSEHLRVWEVAGTAHGDSYMNNSGLTDSGALSIAELARVFEPTRESRGFEVAVPMNSGIVHHYVFQAAIARLDAWLRTGNPPPSTAPLQLTETSPPTPVLDANGIAQGGVRSPWVDAPTLRLTGTGNTGSPLASFVGIGEPLDAATLTRLYPGGRADYLRRFEASLDAAIAAGHVLAADRSEILALAAETYPAA